MNFRVHIAVFLFVLIAAGFVAPATAQQRAPPHHKTSGTKISAAPAPQKQIAPPAAVLPEAPPDPKTEAIRLLGRKQYATACLLLEKSYPSDTKDVSVIFLRARCRMGLKDYDKALELYEQLVEISPDSPRAKTEMEKALQLFRARHTISYVRTETGFTYDTNINSGPQTDQIIIGGVPINLGQEPIDSTGYLASAIGGYIYPVSRRLSLSGRLSASKTDYFHPSDNSVDNYSFSLGPAWTFGKTQFSLSPGYSWQAFGGSAYNSSLDLGARLSTKLKDGVTAAVNMSLNKNNYRTVPEKNGIAYSFSPSLSMKLTPKLTSMMSLILRFENDEASYYSNDSFGFRFGLTHVLTKDLDANISYQLTGKDYESADGIFSTDPREDEQQVLSAGLTWDIGTLTKTKSTDLNIKYQLIKTNSNISIYDLKRHVFLLTVSKIW